MAIFAGKVSRQYLYSYHALTSPFWVCFQQPNLAGLHMNSNTT